MLQRRKVEDYVKTIYLLQENGSARSTDIAKALKVSKPTVSVTLKSLEEEGFLHFPKNHVIVLTEKGLKIAEDVVKRNRIFYNLLINLGVDNDTAKEDACNMEHAISQKSFKALMELAECQSGAEEKEN